MSEMPETPETPDAPLELNWAPGGRSVAYLTAKVDYLEGLSWIPVETPTKNCDKPAKPA